MAAKANIKLLYSGSPAKAWDTQANNDATFSSSSDGTMVTVRWAAAREFDDDDDDDDEKERRSMTGDCTKNAVTTTGIRKHHWVSRRNEEGAMLLKTRMIQRSK